MLNVRGTISYIEKHGIYKVRNVLKKRTTEELKEMYKDLIIYELEANTNNWKKHQLEYVIIQKLKKIQDFYKKNGINYWQK